eukprot:TRINITY_DN1522_c0_g1_i1.p2 TRINITY_DN1522_c0_g1~~TRINITY_DN1522_c0_g1_i1.p2  ORF type:complete len:151 (-),score=19.77 TRINITY_DN1522_c0_g1_i1:175-627(-)
MNRLWFGFPPPSGETRYRIVRNNKEILEVFCKFSFEQRILGQERLLRITFTTEPSENGEEYNEHEEIAKDLMSNSRESPEYRNLNGLDETRVIMTTSTQNLSASPPYFERMRANPTSPTNHELKEERADEKQEGVQPSQRERISILSLLN